MNKFELMNPMNIALPEFSGIGDKALWTKLIIFRREKLNMFQHDYFFLIEHGLKS